MNIWRLKLLNKILTWGTVVGIIHFVILGALYANPFIDRFYKEAQQKDPGVKKWPNQKKYLLYMFLGTQIEVYILALGFFWLRPIISHPGMLGALFIGLLFTGIRVYPRFWNMWIQSTYPKKLLAIEVVNGTISTLLIILGLQLFAG